MKTWLSILLLTGAAAAQHEMPRTKVFEATTTPATLDGEIVAFGNGDTYFSCPHAFSAPQLLTGGLSVMGNHRGFTTTMRRDNLGGFIVLWDKNINQSVGLKVHEDKGPVIFSKDGNVYVEIPIFDLAEHMGIEFEPIENEEAIAIPQ